MLKRFDPDAVLFRQGDPSDQVILILSGSADVLRETGDEAIVLGTVQAGEFVGEMGVLEGRRAQRHRARRRGRRGRDDRAPGVPRAGQRRARAGAQAAAAHERPAARRRGHADPAVRRATRRADAAGRELVAAAPTVEAPPSLTLTGATYGAKFFIGPEPIRIPHLPFTVGRRHDQHEPPSVITPDLAIGEDEPHRLSRAHFSLIRDGDDILVRDLNSTLGTIVNGQPLGRDFPVDSAPLRTGREQRGRRRRRLAVRLRGDPGLSGRPIGGPPALPARAARCSTMSACSCPTWRARPAPWSSSASR